jgi:D-3-phosphoglycerate dehydrogenase / 2-oxoglutarate reductase
MTSPQDIHGHPRGAVPVGFSPSSFSASPTAAQSLPQQFQSASWNAQYAQRAEKQLKPFNTQDIKILLLENVNKAGQEVLRQQGYQVEALKTSLPEDQLIEKIRYVVELMNSI